MESDRRSRRRVVIYRAELPHTSPVEYWQVEYEAVADALHFACRDLREGRRRPVEIIQDGVVLYDAAALVTVCREREDPSVESRDPA